MGTLMFLGVLALIPISIIGTILCRVAIFVASGEELEWNPRNTARFIGGPLDGDTLTIRILRPTYCHHGQQHISIYHLQGDVYVFQKSVVKCSAERNIS